ncbi:hypothetical protein ACHMW5_13830 [Azospirillum melinis]|uniref:hypothetical protein n=1 Tax=Azospirillum melinis TaxID=328839 RepID=UPI0037571679
MSIERDLYRLTCPKCGHEGEMLWKEHDRTLEWDAEVTGFKRKRVYPTRKVLGICTECGFEGEITVDHLRSV